MPIPRRPGSSSAISECMPSAIALAIVVHFCPDGGTHCRSSVHTRHSAGGCVAAGTCPPHVTQIQTGSAPVVSRKSLMLLPDWTRLHNVLRNIRTSPEVVHHPPHVGAVEGLHSAPVPKASHASRSGAASPNPSYLLARTVTMCGKT